MDIVIYETALPTQHEWEGLHGKTIPDVEIYRGTINNTAFGFLLPGNYIHVPNSTIGWCIKRVDIFLDNAGNANLEVIVCIV